jgi:phage shock protein PspC (stress-responsive transcriptional regulator)
MGTPEAISNEEEAEKVKGPEKKVYYTNGKRLYRDVDDRILAGVCSGLGAYFSMDPVIVRIIFVLAFFLGVGVGRMMVAQKRGMRASLTITFGDRTITYQGTTDDISLMRRNMNRDDFSPGGQS